MCLDAQLVQKLLYGQIFELDEQCDLILAQCRVKLLVSVRRVDYLRGELLTSYQIISLKTKPDDPDELSLLFE